MILFKLLNRQSSITNYIYRNMLNANHENQHGLLLQKDTNNLVLGVTMYFFFSHNIGTWANRLIVIKINTSWIV